MQWNRTVITVFVACGIGGGVGALFGWNPSTAAPPTDLPAMTDTNAYETEVQALLKTTYLGHKKELPDPEEPVEVLQQYLEQNAHGYHSQLAGRKKELKAKVQAWKELTRQHPQSRHAWVALAKLYRTKAEMSGNLANTRLAADAYIRAVEIGLAHGRILYTRQLSDLLVELGDKQGLEDIFGRILAQPLESDQNAYYSALVSYADGLAQLGDERAWDHFEAAIALHPENNLEAINRYAQHLLNYRKEQKALEVLDTYLTAEQRMRFVVPAQLRKRALQSLSLETTSADAELAQIEQQLRGAWSVAPATTLVGTNSTTLRPAETDMTVQAATADSRVSALFGIPPEDPTTQDTLEDRIKQSGIFTDATRSPDGAIYSSWPNMTNGGRAKKLAAIKWANSNAGLVRIRAENNNVSVRLFTAATGKWGSWTELGALPGGWAIDIAATAYPNGQADIFAVSNLNCSVYQSHYSTTTQTWGGWVWWGSCGDQLTVASMPDGTAWAALRTQFPPPYIPTNVVVVRYFNGASWEGAWNLPNNAQTLTGEIEVRDLNVLAYPSPANGVKATLWVVGSDNCSIYYRNWDPNKPSNSQWTNWTWWSSTPCLKEVSSFPTSNGGAYLLFIGTNGTLYTERFTGSNWGSITARATKKSWIAVAGVNIDEDIEPNSWEHVAYSDDCRVQPYTNGPVCDNYGNCFWTQGVNLAEIIYNEAHGETRAGAQAMVAWTVRDRAFQKMKSKVIVGQTSYCDSYVGGDNPCGPHCNQEGFCDNTKRYCCAMHGAQMQWGASGYQFNDEHVDINTLSTSGEIWEAIYVGNGWTPDVSTGWCPTGVGNCQNACDAPGSAYGDNYDTPSPQGPMEFLAYDYCAQVNKADLNKDGKADWSLSECKWYSADVCGDTNPVLYTKPLSPPGFACDKTTGANDNYFWNRVKP